MKLCEAKLRLHMFPPWEVILFEVLKKKGVGTTLSKGRPFNSRFLLMVWPLIFMFSIYDRKRKENIQIILCIVLERYSFTMTNFTPI